jgi:hypothetical protein
MKKTKEGKTAPRRRIRRARPLLVVAAGAVLLAGCGDTTSQPDVGVIGDMGVPAFHG